MKQATAKSKDKREGLQGKNVEDCGMSSRREVSWLRKGYGMLPRKKLEDRGALATENRNQLRGYKAMHEENFLSSWLREEVVGGKNRK